MDGVMHPSVEQAIGRDRIRNALKRYENNPADEHDRGIVRAVNSDGSYEVLLDGDVQTARCAPYAKAMVGDRVIVVTTKDGENVLLGRLGGEPKGGSIKSGETDGWYWEKWDNGKAYCKKETLVSWVSPVDAWGSAYMSPTTYGNGEYPFSFIEKPKTNVYLNGSGSGDRMTGTWVVGSSFGTESVSPTVWLMNNNGSASYDKGGYLVTEAEGFWKEPDGTEIYAIGGGSGGGSCDCDVEGAIARRNADEDAHQDIRDRIEEIAASGGSGGTGFFTLEVDEDGNLYAIYDDGDEPPSFELDSDGNLYYVIEE